MFRILLILLAVLLTASLLLFSDSARNRAYKLVLGGLLNHDLPEIDIPAAARAAEAVFLDAREPVEYQVSHIEGALNVGFNHFDLQSVAHIPKDTPVIVYCSVGFRSEKIAKKNAGERFHGSQQSVRRNIRMGERGVHRCVQRSANQSGTRV